MQTVALLVLGFLATSCFSKPHHHHHKDSGKIISTSYPEEKPNQLCLDYSEDGRLYYNLKYICHANKRMINYEISEERSAIHGKIFNEDKLTEEDIDTVCMHSDEMKKVNSANIYGFMKDNILPQACNNSEQKKLAQKLALYVNFFPSEVRAGVIPTGNLSKRMKNEDTANNIVENPAVATHILHRWESPKAVPVEIRKHF